MFQESFLKFLCKIYLFFFKLFGLWPFTYDSKTKSFSLNLFYAIIPFVLVPFYCITSIRDLSFLLDKVKVVFRNIVLKMVSNVYLASNLFFSVCIYGTQYQQYGRIKRLFHKIRKLLTSFGQWFPMDEVNYLPQLLKFTLRAFIFTIMYEIYHVFSVSAIAPNTFGVFTIFGFVLPNFILKFYPDIFYGGMLVAHFYFQQINKEIRHILNAAIVLRGTQDEKLTRNLSKKLENVAVHYFHLIEIVKEFNSITSFRVLLWMCLWLWNFIIHLFMQYVFLGVPLRYGHTLNIAISMTGLADTVLQFFEFWLTTSICTKLINEINETETMLCSMYIHLRHNDQFKEIVIGFSLRFYLNKNFRINKFLSF